jgi:hypothetical protein
MFFLWKRYSRSGYAPPLFYVIMAIGFVALAVWAITQRDWLVATIALAMLVVTASGARIMRGMNNAASSAPTETMQRERRDE